jgi:hypothetical protein
MTDRVINRWDIEAILNRELHKHSQCSSCRFVGFDSWNGEGNIFDHVTVECGDLSPAVYGEIAEKIIAEARCTYEDVDVE